MRHRSRLAWAAVLATLLAASLAVLAAKPSPAAEPQAVGASQRSDADPSPERAREPAPGRLLVTAREWSLSLSKPKLDSGEAIVDLYNYGEDPHDLRLRRVGSRRVYKFAEVEPGDTGRLEMKLRRASRYRLWCSLPYHAELGMKARLRTSKQRR